MHGGLAGKCTKVIGDRRGWGVVGLKLFCYIPGIFMFTRGVAERNNFGPMMWGWLKSISTVSGCTCSLEVYLFCIIL